jgi:hypothetical protein
MEVTLPELFTVKEKDELIELSYNGSLLWVFKKLETDFCLTRQKKYLFISDKALKFFLVFRTTCLCECTFSAMIYVRKKYRNTLNIEPDLRHETYFCSLLLSTSDSENHSQNKQL